MRSLYTLLAGAALVVHGKLCEQFCIDPCTELNGDIGYECGACTERQFKCQPGAVGFVNWKERRQTMEQNEPSGFKDPAPHCNSVRCRRVREKLEQQFIADAAAGRLPKVPPPPPPSQPVLAAVNAAGAARSVDYVPPGPYAWTSAGVAALKDTSPDTYRRFGEPKPSSPLHNDHISFLHENSFPLVHLFTRGLIRPLSEAPGEPAADQGRGEGSSVEYVPPGPYAWTSAGVAALKATSFDTYRRFGEPKPGSPLHNDHISFLHENSFPLVHLFTRGLIRPLSEAPGEPAADQGRGEGSLSPLSRLGSGAAAPTPQPQSVSTVAGVEVVCALPRFDGSYLRGLSAGERRAQLSKPSIITGLLDSWGAMATWRDGDSFSARFGNQSVLAKRVLFGHQMAHAVGADVRTSQVSVADLVTRTAQEHIIVIDEPGASVGENAFLEATYPDWEVPDFLTSISQSRVLSFGGGHRGVQMMQHGVAWLGLVAGAKLWHIAPPDLPRPSNRECDNGGKVDWALAASEGVEHCVMKPGEVIFVPDDWWHATCNLETYTVGVGAQLWKPSQERLSIGSDAATKDYWSSGKHLRQELVEAVSLPPSPQGASTYSPPSARAPPRAVRPPATPELVGRSCTPYLKQLGGLRICPILNGVWSSFLDHAKWGDEGNPVPKPLAQSLAREMLKYDSVGMTSWVGEDFDQRVLSVLSEHRQAVLAGATTTTPLYTVIVEEGEKVPEMAQTLEDRLGRAALAWMQVGPPALERLSEYAALKQRGLVTAFGVEDYSDAQIQEAHAAFGVATVQQEINLLSHPSPQTVQLCQKIGCQFVGYGPLLGGLVADTYLGAPRPVTDANHREYSYTIDAWGGWGAFQRLLQVLRHIADRHEVASIATVAIAYLLSLPRMLAVIVGVRLGINSDHRADSLAALALNLAPVDTREIDAAVFHADPSCTSEQCTMLRAHRNQQ